MALPICLKAPMIFFFLEEDSRLTPRSQRPDVHRENYHSFHLDDDKNSGAHHLYIHGDKNSAGQYHNFVQQLRPTGINGSRSHDNHLELCDHDYQRCCSVDSHILRNLHRSRQVEAIISPLRAMADTKPQVPRSLAILPSRQDLLERS